MTFRFQCEAVSAVLRDHEHPAKLDIRDTGAGWREKRKKSDGISERPADLSLLAPSDADEHKLSEKECKRSKVAGNRKPWASKMTWNAVRIPIEIKTSQDQQTPSYESYNDGKTSRKARGRLAEYVAQVNISQHRTFTLAVTIDRRNVYLTYWDPAGVVIAEPFDFITQPEKLFLFMYRVGQMSDTQLGYDPTVQRTEETDADVQALRAFEPVLPHHKKYLAEAFPGASQWPVHRVEIKDKEEKKHTFLIGKNRHASQSAVGRGTRGYVAYDTEAKELRWLKDFWRPDTSDHTHEYDFYLQLHEKGVSNIATPVCGGDVCSPEEHMPQRTLAQEYLSAYQTPRIHHRIVVEEVCRSLEEYKNSRELCRVVYGAFCGKPSPTLIYTSPI